MDEAQGTASATLSDEETAALAERAGEMAKNGQTALVRLQVETDDEASALTITLPGAPFGELAADGRVAISIDTPIGQLFFDAEALRVIRGAAADGDISFTIAYASLPEAVKQELGDRPAYAFAVVAGGQRVADFGEGRVHASIPYSLRPGEEAGSVIVYHIADSGQLDIIRGKYSPASGTVDFVAAHFSQFLIGYNKVTFADVPATQWYGDAVGFLAARSLTNGTGEGRFSPNTPITRGEFVTLLMRAYGIQPDAAGADNFDDAGDNVYYTGYLAAAKRLGIAAGVGGNRFAPDQTITRQELVAFLHRALQTLRELPAEQPADLEARFGDAHQAADYAHEAFRLFVASGIVEGSDAKLRPAANATRAEAAQILYRLLLR